MTPAGFPHSEIHGSKPACGSPWLIAAYHVFLRRPVPWHPPCALSNLIVTNLSSCQRIDFSIFDCFFLLRPTAKLFAFLRSCVISNTFATGFFTRCFFHLAVQFSRYRMKCVSRRRFLLPLRFASFLCFRSGFSLPAFPHSLRFASSFHFRFRLPLFRFFPFGFSLPVSFLRSRFGSPRSLRFASSFPLRFRAALRFPLLRFPALPSAFASGFARSALPFGFRLRSSLRILPFQVSCALSFFASFPFGFFASRFPPSLSLRFSAFALLRFPLSLPLCFRFASRFAFRFPAVFFIPIQFSVLSDP